MLSKDKNTHTDTETMRPQFLLQDFNPESGSVQSLSHIQLCDSMDDSTPGFPVHHQLPELAQTHVHRVSDTIQPSQPLYSPPPLAFTFPSIMGFPNDQFFISGDQSIGVSASASFLPMNIQGWLPLGLTGLISLQSKGLSRVFSNTTVFQWSVFFMVQLSNWYTTTGKTTALTRWTFVGKVMSLLFNMLSRLVIALVPRSKYLLTSWLHSPSAVVLEPKRIKYVIVSPSICHEVMGSNAMIFIFWMLNFKPTFSLFFHFHQEALYFFFAFCHKVGVICIYMLIDISPGNLEYSLCFIHFACCALLNKQGDNIQPWSTSFPIWNQSVVPCLALTVASWPAFRFLEGR